jgi:CheY-like chemotaxis protein
MRGSAGTAAPSRRLLIVGDMALSRGLMRMVLSRLGYVVTCVASGQEALASLAHTPFALVLIALQLPDLPGLTLARRLRAAPGPVGSMPILLFGDAWDPERMLASCREAGLDGYLPKPISIGRLVSSVRDLIQRAPASGEEPPAPDQAPPVPAPIALDRFTSFTDGDGQLERELGSLYVATADLYLEEMRAALGGSGGWSRAAHSLKGASANIGATEMARLAAQAEKAPASPELLAALDEALAEVRRFFRDRTRTGMDARAAALPQPG